MRRALLTLLFLLACTCSGGGGTQVAGGGIGGTGISTGSVTGFGSFFVTGTEWNLGFGGTVEIDGQPATAADLALGMFLRVEGTRSSDGLQGLASRVRFDEAVRGPIAQEPVPDPVVTGRVTFTVLGRTVMADDGPTVFAGTTFATLAMDDVVEVSGPVASDGTIRATRIEKVGTLALGTTQVDLKGQVTGLDGGMTGFAIGTVGIALDDCDGMGMATEIDPDVEPLANGDFVEVEGVQTAAAPDPEEVNACRIRPFTPLAQEIGEDTENVEVEGVIEDFASLADFTVNGVPVDASAAALDPSDPSLYRDGVLVEVSGDVVAGTLVASRVELEEGDARVSAEVTSAGLANVAENEIVLLDDGAGSGLVVEVDPSTLRGDNGGEEQDEGPLDLANLNPGDFLRVRGLDLGGGRLRATDLEREDSGDAVRIRGRVESIDADDTDGVVGFTVLGVFVEIGDSTDLPNGATVPDFLSVLSVGDLVEARDGDNDLTTFDLALQVELKDE